MSEQRGLFTRSDVEAFGQMLLAAHGEGRFDRDEGQGVSDAAFGRTYADRRRAHADRPAYDFGYRVGRFILFAGLPKWRAAMLTKQDSLEWMARYRASQEARA